MEDFDFNSLDKEVQVVLLLTNHKQIKVDKLYNMDMFGLPMKEYVKNCFKNAPICEKEYDEQLDLLMQVKGCDLGDRKYTMVLFSDTPLLKRQTILEIIEYVKMKSLSVLKLTRGYVFETNYLKTIDKLYAPQLHYFDEEDFMNCFDNKQLGLILDILRNRILAFNMKKGVILKSPETTRIDINASIESGVVIEANNTIKGKSIIETNSHLKENNVIENSVIKNNVTIENSTIKDSFIEENCVVMPYCLIENNSYLESGSKIDCFCKIDNALIKKDSKLKSFSEMIGEDK